MDLQVRLHRTRSRRGPQQPSLLQMPDVLSRDASHCSLASSALAALNPAPAIPSELKSPDGELLGPEDEPGGWDDSHDVSSQPVSEAVGL